MILPAPCFQASKLPSCANAESFIPAWERFRGGREGSGTNVKGQEVMGTEAAGLR